ncbi:MAG TPA: WXG100 family type VII secretion target [Symbiobacteriaceae bacterium]|nr:WXG100 family type VII secretion target [Symbiobacteriaceae bacterium]
MTTRIRITPEQVRTVARQFKSSSDQSQDMVNKLNTQVNAMGADWEGLTKEQFYQQFTEWKGRMEQFVVLLDDINKQLIAIATRFENADRGQAG